MTHAEGYALVFGREEQDAIHIDLPALVHRHAALLFRVAHSIVRNPQEAEDVVQDTFVRVLQHRGKLPAIREERVWLLRIAWNLALDRRRRMRSDQMDDAFAETLAARLAPADRVLEDAARLRRTLAAMDALPQSERAVLLLSAFDEMSTAEIAAVVGKTESAVRALLFRARTRLRERVSTVERAPDRTVDRTAERKGGAR